MPNALQSMGTPPVPNPQPNQPEPVSAMAPGSAPQGQAPQQQPLPPPPSHQQTVAALRHFDAIEHELTTLLSDPDLGKADMKSKIIDGTTSLVASRIISPASAVMQLGSVPDRPFDQKQWLQTHLAQTVQAATAVLAHHAMGGPAQDQTPPNPEDHLDVMSGLMGQYSGGKPNG